MLSSIGHFSLNLAFGLYLILYLPQIIHNARHMPFERMSVIMHLMLFLAYSCDLCYGIARQMPWQYITVSSVGLGFLITQHLQWSFFNFKQSAKKGCQFVIIGFLVILLPQLLLMNFPEAKWQIHLQAWIARTCFLLHFLPQIIKYLRQELNRDAIHLNYLSLSLALSVCDLIAAYCLNWDIANVVGSLISLSLKLFLASQIIRQSNWAYLHK